MNDLDLALKVMRAATNFMNAETDFEAFKKTVSEAFVHYMADVKEEAQKCDTKILPPS